MYGDNGVIASSGQPDRYGLVAALATRRRHLPLRLAVSMLIAGGLHLVLGWWAAWPWAAVYWAVQLIEAAIGKSVLKHPPQTVAAAAHSAIVLFVPSAIVFGALAPALWMSGGRYGAALAVALIASSMTNLIAISHGSRVAFAASAIPYGLYLLVMPLMDAQHTAGPILTTMMIAVGLVMINVVGAWITTEEARKAQDDAIAEAERRRQEAEAAVEAKSAFVAMISHELRTPISAIMAGAKELERGATSVGGAQAQLIGDAGRMMRTLLNDLLDLSRLEAGRMDVEHIAFDLRRCVADAVRMWRPQARAKGLRLRIEGAVHLPRWMAGDPTRLRQVLNNLLSNAIKFTDHGSVTLSLYGGSESAGRRKVSLAVADTGPGMTPEQIDRLFTPFDQLDAGTARKHGGSGLGLVISRELARLMDGDLTVTSERGHGAQFLLTLDLEVCEPPAAELAPAAVEARVMVVDDHAINRQAIALVLAPLGIEPVTAASAEEALERLAREPFDVILMDVYMPDMDGRNATRLLRSLPGPNQATPVIAITASATARDWDACLAAGMNAYVGKPIEPSQLYAALEQVVAADAAAAVAA